MPKPPGKGTTDSATKDDPCGAVCYIDGRLPQLFELCPQGIVVQAFTLKSSPAVVMRSLLLFPLRFCRFLARVLILPELGSLRSDMHPVRYKAMDAQRFDPMRRTVFISETYFDFAAHRPSSEKRPVVRDRDSKIEHGAGPLYHTSTVCISSAGHCRWRLAGPRGRSYPSFRSRVRLRNIHIKLHLMLHLGRIVECARLYSNNTDRFRCGTSTSCSSQCP